MRPCKYAGDLLWLFSAALLISCTGCARANNVVSAAHCPVPDARFPSSTRVLGQATVYYSATGEKLEVVHDAAGGIAILKMPDGGMEVIPAEFAGLEGRYRDEHMTVWENDGVVLLWVDGILLFSGKSKR